MPAPEIGGVEPAGSRGEPFWTTGLPASRFAELTGNLQVDVAIIGGGIVGLTAAFLLKRAGRRVAVIEARRIGGATTGRSTAKITSQHGLIYRQLVASFGDTTARIYGEANQAAVRWIGRMVEEQRIECELEPKPAYVFTTKESEISALEKEAETAARLGLPASFVRDVPLPMAAVGAVRFDSQAQFHPAKYLAGLAQLVDGGGCHVFERTRAIAIDQGTPTRVHTDRGTIAAFDVIVATHLPTVKEGTFFAKAHPFAHPMLAGRLDPARDFDGMFISTGSPSISFRTAAAGHERYLVAVGRRYRPGHAEDAEKAMDDLVQLVSSRFGLSSIAHRWTNQDYAPMDGLPMVGRASSGTEHLFVATGFNAWGISNGTVAGMILADLIRREPNPWADVFDATRFKLLKGAPEFVGKNVQVAKELVGGYVKRPQATLAAIAAGDGAVLELDGERVAAHRDDEGRLHAISAVCTHMKCMVGWNPVERSWDCACHGSRFDVDGQVIHGPAVSPLTRKELPPDAT
jgi:glycine/D-amino acid oxidase-like deaminating enzyme/nitrite reductase/ring-hydroxylating ferredoxin subunit